MTLWRRICLRNRVKKDHGTFRRSRTRLGTNDGGNGMLKVTEIGCGKEGLLGKRKIGHPSIWSNEDRACKKQKMRENNRVYDGTGKVKKKQETSENIRVGAGTTDVDCFSELPEPIGHHIFKFISCTKDVVRTSTLSKKLRSMFKSYSNFEFDERWFKRVSGKGKHNRIKAREIQKKNFKRYVDQSLASRLDAVPCIDQFRLYVKKVDHVLGASVARWVRSALDKDVKELEIHVDDDGKHFMLPNEVLLSTSITFLKLSGFVIPGLNDLKLSNLQKLSIKDAVLPNPRLFKKLEENCPLIEDLRLVCCSGLLILSISALLKLRRVEVHECSELSVIGIEAPNLETFLCHKYFDQRCEFGVIGSRNLKNLNLKDIRMTDSAFQDFIAKYPLLEKLVLHGCDSLEKLTILSGNLKCLALIHCANLQEASIDAPNLYSFEYSGHRMSFSSMNVRDLSEAKIHFAPTSDRAPFTVEYQSLFRTFAQPKGFKIITYCPQNMEIYEAPEEVKPSSTYYRNIEVTASPTNLLKIVDKWLRECRGNSLILHSPSTELLKLLDAKMMNRDVDPKCCAFYSNKCWRHYLVDVELMTRKNKKSYLLTWRYEKGGVVRRC